MAIEISTPAELDAMRLDLTAQYALVNDIDMTGFGNWIPVGDIVTAQFTGALFGAGHKISNIVIATTPGESQRRGLFGSFAGAVFDLGLENVSFSSNPTFLSGAIAGAASSSGSVSRCWATGSWVASGGYYEGGLVGSAALKISDCWFRGDLTLGTANSGNPWSGGICGSGSGSAVRCYYAGAIQPVTGDVQAPGGISGEPTVVSSFFDSDLAVDVSPDPLWGTPQTTANMKTLATYTGAGWDIADVSGTPSALSLSRVWGIDPAINDGYPFLQTGGFTTVAIIGVQSTLTAGASIGTSQKHELLVNSLMCPIIPVGAKVTKIGIACYAAGGDETMQFGIYTLADAGNPDDVVNAELIATHTLTFPVVTALQWVEETVNLDLSAYAGKRAAIAFASPAGSGISLRYQNTTAYGAPSISTASISGPALQSPWPHSSYANQVIGYYAEMSAEYSVIGPQITSMSNTQFTVGQTGIIITGSGFGVAP